MNKMKTIKNRLLAILCAITCFSAVGLAATMTSAKADGNFTVESITYQFREVENRTKGSQRTDYLIKLNADKDLLSAYDDGAEITDMTTFGDSVKANDTALSGLIANGVSDVEPYKLYKQGENILRISLGRSLGYVSFTLPQDLAIGGYTLADEVKLYQDDDGSFTATEPEYKINGVFASLNGDDRTVTKLKVAMTRPFGVDQTGVDEILINGTKIDDYDNTYVQYWNDTDANWGSDGDTGFSNYHFYIFIMNEKLMNNGITLTFPEGYKSHSTNATEATTEAVSFSFPALNYGTEIVDKWNYPTGIKTDVKEIGVKDISLAYREPYNGDDAGRRTEYVLNFNADKDLFAAYVKGDQVKDFSGLGSFVKANTTALEYTAGGYKLYKEGENSLRVVLGRALGYVSFTLPAGLTYNGYTLKTSVTYYQNTDGTFTTTEPEYRVNDVFLTPYYNPSNAMAEIQFAMTKAENITKANKETILINGKPLSQYTENTDGQFWGGNSVYWDTDGDPGYAGYHFRFRLANTILNNGITITVPQGFTTGGTYTTAKTQNFYFAAGNYTNNWTQYKDFKAIPFTSTAEMNFSFVEKSQNNVTYKLSFDVAAGGASDIFADFTEGTDMSAFVKASAIPSHITFNGSDLSKYTVTYKKGGANEILFTVSGELVPPIITISTGYISCDCLISGDGKLFSSNADYSLKTGIDEASVTDVTSQTSYGTMSRTTELRFTLEFDDIGLFSSFEDGTNITSYLNTNSFTDNVLINDVSLTSIATSRTIAMYKRGRDAGVYTDTQNAIEVIISGPQLFDYDVTVKEGCVVGNVQIEETVTYRKNYNESFDKLTAPDTDVKPIAIREVPYGDYTYRCVKVIFNNYITNDSYAAVNGTIKNSIQYCNANGAVTFDQSAGGYYFNKDLEAGGRMYMIYFYTSEYEKFITSEGAKITISSFKTPGGQDTVATTFVMNNGSWTPEDYDGEEIIKAEIVAIRHPGNQYDGTKVIQFISSVSYNYDAFPKFVMQNLYINGKKVSDYNYSANYCNPELVQNGTVYDNKWYSIYVDDEIRNYETGIDVIYLKAGAPLAAGRTFTEDQYFYAVQDKTQRDGAGNFVWTITKEKPALRVASQEKYEVVGDNTVLTVNFDRVVAKNDVHFGKYNATDVSALLTVNGKTIAEYGADASYVFTDSAIKITVKTAVLGDVNAINLTFKNGFTTPLGYAFTADKTRCYSVKDDVWANSLEVKKESGSVTPDGVTLETVRVGGTAAQPKVGKKITVKFNGLIAGKTALIGTQKYGESLATVKTYKNITAPYADLIALTKLGNEGKAFGYSYAPEIIERIVTVDLRNSILDGILLNGKTIREIIAAETAYVALDNYPVSVDLDGDCLVIYIQQDSAFYAQVVDGLKLELNEDLTFEYDNGVNASAYYELKDGEFSVYRFYKSITVKTNKKQYTAGQDLDLTKFTAYGVYNDDEKGDDIEITADMISGYDKNKVGKQTITITYEGLTDTVEIEVVAANANDNTGNDNTGNNGGNTGDTTPQKKGCGEGCGANIVSDGTLVLGVALLGMAFIVIKILRKKNNGQN